MCANLNDVSGIGTKFERERAKLRGEDDDYDTSQLPDEDVDAILNYLRDERLDGDKSRSTLHNYLVSLRVMMEATDEPLVDLNHDGFRDLLAEVKADRGLSDSSIRNYKVAARQLYKHVDEDWADDIDTKRHTDSTVSPDDLLQKDDFEALMDTVDNTRDKALLSVLFDTGLRVSAIATLRVRDVDLEGRVSKVTLNNDVEDGLKGASGTRPLTWSSGYVANWLDVHPSPEPEHPLWHKKRLYEDGDRALSYARIWEILKDLARDADVDPDKVNPHNFRHSAISRWVREGFSDQEIKHRATWHEDSSMLSVYSHIRDEDMNEQIAERYGIVDDEESTPDLDRCVKCQTELPDPMPRCCPGCGTPLRDSAVETIEQIQGDGRKDLADLSGEDAERVLRFLEMVDEHPEIAEAFDRHDLI